MLGIGNAAPAVVCGNVAEQGGAAEEVDLSQWERDHQKQIDQLRAKKKVELGSKIQKVALELHDLQQRSLYHRDQLNRNEEKKNWMKKHWKEIVRFGFAKTRRLKAKLEGLEAGTRRPVDGTWQMADGTLQTAPEARETSSTLFAARRRRAHRRLF